MSDFPVFEENAYLPELGLNLIQRIGDGAQAEVWLVNDLNDPKKKFAARISAMEVAKRGSTPYENWQRKLHRETRIWRAFEDSLFVLKLRNSDLYSSVTLQEQEYDLFVQTMKFIPHSSLDLHIYGSNRQNFLNLVGRGRELIRFLNFIAEALHGGHKKNIVHGDLKPKNILLHVEAGKTGYPMLMDFGISEDKTINDQSVLNGFIGTPEYAAPELLRNEVGSGTPTDIYSLGVIFLEILTGKKYIEATDGLRNSEQRIEGTLAQIDAKGSILLNDFNDDIGLDDTQKLQLQNLLTKMLEQDHQLRTIPLAQCRQDLERIVVASGGDTIPIPETFIEQNRYRWPKWIHTAIGERPVYYVFKSNRSFQDEEWLKKKLITAGIEGYSLYRLLGPNDFMVRLWVNDIQAKLADGIFEDYKEDRHYQAFVEKVEVLDYDVSQDFARNISTGNKEDVLKEIALSWNANQDIEFATLKEKKLVTSILRDDRSEPTSIRVFMFILAPKDGLDDILWDIITQRLQKTLEGFVKDEGSAIKNISRYKVKTMSSIRQSKIVQSGVMFRFILNDYHLYPAIVENIGTSKKALQASIEVPMRITSLFELDKECANESDDGQIIREAYNYHTEGH